MLPSKRLFYILFIVLLISGGFFFFNLNQSSSHFIELEKPELVPIALKKGKEPNKIEEPTYYVVGSKKKEDSEKKKTENSGIIYKNVIRLMGDLKLKHKIVEFIPPEAFQENIIPIFCQDVIRTQTDLSSLEAFLRDGGKAVFAAGLAEGYEDAYLQPVLGIIEKSIKENYQEFIVAKDFFPLQQEKMKFAGFNASTWISLRQAADIYMKDADSGVPIVYSYGYEKGKVLVINGTMLENYSCMGIMTSGLGKIVDNFIYPVMGTESIFLDNFPMVTYVDDTLCMKYYGRTTESFVRDVVWPVFEGMAVRHELRYTSSVLTASSEEGAFPKIDRELFYTMGKSALQYEGELVYGINLKKTEQVYFNQLFLDKFKEIFKKYKITGIVNLGSKSIESAARQLESEVYAIRGNLLGEREEEYFSYHKENNTYVLPGATWGNNLSDGNMLSIASMLSSHGMLSHTFDMNLLISNQRGEGTWDQQKKEISAYEESVFRKTGYLDAVTLSQAGNRLNSYVSLDYSIQTKGNTTKIFCSNFLEGQTFLYQTKKRVTDCQGLTAEKIADGWVLLRLLEGEAEFTLK